MKATFCILLSISLLFISACDRASDEGVQDTSPPGMVTDFLVEDPGEGGVLDLSWGNPDDEDLAGVLLVRKEGSAPADRDDGQAVCDADPVSAAPACAGNEAHRDRGLSDGTSYHYAAFAYDESGNFSQGAVATATPQNSLPPLGLSTFDVVDSNTDQALDLSWTQQPGQHPDYSGMRILRFVGQAPDLGALDPSSPPDDAVVALDDHNPARVQYTDEFLVEGQEYFYVAYARDTAGNFGPGSLNSGVPVRPGLVLPPTSLSIDNPGTGNTLDIAWVNSVSPDADFVRVIRFLDDCIQNPDPTDYDMRQDFEVTGVGQAQSFVDSGLTDGQIYCYALFAKAGNDYSEALIASAGSTDITPPEVVDNFQVVNTGAGNSLEITWQSPGGDYEGCVVQRKEGSSPTHRDDGVRVFEPGAGTGFVDEGLTDGIEYYYAAWSFDDASNWSMTAAQASAVPQDTTAPGQISDFQTVAQDDGSISLSWLAPDPVGDFAGVLILRRSDSYPLVHDDDQAQQVHLGTGVNADDTYTQVATRYYYSAFSLDDSGLYSEPVSSSDITRCGMVSNLSLQNDVDQGQVNIAWDNPQDSEFHAVRIVRRTDNSPQDPQDGQLVAGCDDPGMSSCVDTSPVINVRNYYGVYAHNQAGQHASGVMADIVASNDITAPGPVTDFVAQPDLIPGMRSIDLSWQNPADADLDGVIVLRRAGVDPVSPTDSAAQVVCSGRADSCTDEEGVVDGVNYHYRAWAYDEVPNYSAPAEAIATRAYTDDDGDGWHEDDRDCNDMDNTIFGMAPSLSCSEIDYDCDGEAWEDSFCVNNPPANLDPSCSSGVPECVPLLGCDFNFEPDMTMCSATTAPVDLGYDVCIEGACVSPGTCGAEVSCNSAGTYFLLPPASGHSYLTRIGGSQPVVQDNITGLMWMGCQSGSAGDDCLTETGSGHMNYEDALTYCDGQAWAGFDDWYLPDTAELLSILDLDQTPVAVDPAFFPGTTYANFATSLRAGGDPAQVLYVSFQPGIVGQQEQSDLSSVRCVRRASVAQLHAPRFVRDTNHSGEPVVFDQATNVTWQGCQYGRTGDDCSVDASVSAQWAVAVQWCEDLTWAGQTDWRLPNVKEMYSLVDNHSSPHQIDTDSFPRIDAGDHWTISEVPGNRLSVFLDGRVVSDTTNMSRFVRCVRGF